MGVLLAGVVLSVAVVGCGGDDDGAPPTPTAPASLASCVDPEGADEEGACLDQIERFIETDIAGVEHAVQTISDVLSRTSAPSHEFERVSPVPEVAAGVDPATSTDPIELRWKIGGSDRTMFVCFVDEAVDVGPDACST